MSVRGIRGATHLSADDPDEMRDAVVELVSAMMDRNGIEVDDLVSIVFTATADLVSAFPAASARAIGLEDVPLLCAREIDVVGAMPRVIRVLMHADTFLSRSTITHVYTRGAEDLRSDLAN